MQDPITNSNLQSCQNILQLVAPDLVQHLDDIDIDGDDGDPDPDDNNDTTGGR